MTIADRLAIIADGSVVEEGTPRDLYERPVKRFTADFIGENNLLDGHVRDASADCVTVDLGYAQVQVPRGEDVVADGAEVALSVRSELLQLLEPGHNTNGALQAIPATYEEKIYLGLTTSHLVKLPNGAEAVVRRHLRDRPRPALRGRPGSGGRLGDGRGAAAHSMRSPSSGCPANT